jgi:hypothetical protein
MSKLQVSYDDSSDEDDKITDYDVKTNFFKYRNDKLHLLVHQSVQNIENKLQDLKDQLNVAKQTRNANEKYTEIANLLVQILKEEQKNMDEIDAKVSEIQEIEHHLLSFISHAVGISVLYHPKVQKRYYELKREKLMPAVELYSDDEVRERVKSTTDKVICWAGNTKQKAQEFQQKLLVKVDEALMSEEAKWQWVKASDEDRAEHTHALFTEIGINPHDQIRNFSFNFDTKVLDFAKPNTRKVLASTDFDLSTIAPEDFVVEYLAHQRLHNRSEKRCLKNNCTCKNTTWKISDNLEVKLCNKNSWPGCRGEVVRFDGHEWIASYSKVMTLTGLDPTVLETTYMNIKKSLATGTLTNETVSLWYLLFGCEAIKNPAAIVHHAMLIDLVKAGNYIWEREVDESGVDNNICFYEVAPMCSPNSIQPAMALNHEYAEYMPVAYKYQPDCNFPEGRLRERESELMTKWIEYKLREKYFDTLLAIRKNEPQAIDALWSLILNTLESWGIPSIMFQEQTNLL